MNLAFLVSEDHDRFAAVLLVIIGAQEHEPNLFLCNIYIVIRLLRRAADVLLRVQKADGLRPEPRGIRPAACVVIALHREEASARNSGPEQRELLPQQEICVPPADLTGEKIAQMDAAVKLHGLIDGGDVLNGSRDGIVQMRVRDQRDLQIAIAGTHSLNRARCFMLITLIFHIHILSNARVSRLFQSENSIWFISLSNRRSAKKGPVCAMIPQQIKSQERRCFIEQDFREYAYAGDVLCGQTPA